MAFMDRTSATLARVLVFPVPTVAAINGHAFGIGALLALAHDQRVQNSERGWFCLPEVDLQMRFNRFQLAARRRQALAADRERSGAQRPALRRRGVARRGHRRRGRGARRPRDASRPRSRASRVGKQREIVKTLKGDLYAGMLATLE